jgi:hypothetical protein
MRFSGSRSLSLSNFFTRDLQRLHRLPHSIVVDAKRFSALQNRGIGNIPNLAKPFVFIQLALAWRAFLLGLQILARQPVARTPQADAKMACSCRLAAAVFLQKPPLFCEDPCCTSCLAQQHLVLKNRYGYYLI